MAVQMMDSCPDHKAEDQDLLRRDLKTLARFIDFYCRYRHSEAAKEPVTLKTHDLKAIAGKDVVLCPTCCKLLLHAFTKRSHCPQNPKPSCKHCPQHCYHPQFRQQIREVMRYSGKQMLLRGRLDYLFHLLF